jgi:HK97 family phage major capsid protein
MGTPAGGKRRDRYPRLVPYIGGNAAMTLQLTATHVTVRAAGSDGTPSRTIEGLAVPWNVDAVTADGSRVRFLPGSLPEDGPAPKFLRDHELAKPIGIVAERVSTDAGMMFAARVSQTAGGDEALTLALDGVLDAVSVGVEPVEYAYDGPTLVVARGLWKELSLVPFGAYDAARVASVAASSPDPDSADGGKEPTNMENETVTAASPEVIPTQPVTVTAGARKLTPATWLSFAATGRELPAVYAAAAENTTGDVPGIMPDQLVGSVYDTLTGRRPFVSAVGTRGMPSGETFYRRRVTQHTSVSEQSAQFAELASQALEIGRVQVDKHTFGGYVDLSEQMIDWTEPAAVGLVLDDLARVYARQTESFACSVLTDGATETLPITSWADGDEVLDALYDASNTIAGELDALPTHLMVSPDRYADLGKMKDSNGNRLFPAVGPSNAAGSVVPTEYRNVLGLTVIVSPQFATGTFILGAPQGVELYETAKGSIRVDQPATLSTRLAFRGYFAGVVIDSGAFVAFVND